MNDDDEEEMKSDFKEEEFTQKRQNNCNDASDNSRNPKEIQRKHTIKKDHHSDSYIFL